jgi:hypothetical protein
VTMMVEAQRAALAREAGAAGPETA